VRTRVVKSDHGKLDQYLAGVREVERRIQNATASVKLPGTNFQRPVGIPEDFEEHLRLMCDLMVLAFQTDSTRAASFMVTKEATDRNYPWLGFTDGHHDSPRGRGGEEPKAPWRSTVTISPSWHVMIEKMMTVEEADGTTLLTPDGPLR
jgi:hypothetical protein